MLKTYIILLVLITSSIINCGGEKSPANQTRTSESKNVFRIYLVRHAQAYKNITPRPDMSPERLDSLTPEGEKQAAVLGDFLKDKSIGIIYSSPTGRTKQTAEGISRVIKISKSVVLDKSFASLRNGKTPEGEPVTWSWRVEQWKKGHDPRPNGGESLEDGQKRVVENLKQRAKEASDQAIVVVTHGDICSAILAYANSSTITSAYDVNRVDTGSVSEIIISEGEWKSLSMNLLP